MGTSFGATEVEALKNLLRPWDWRRRPWFLPIFASLHMPSAMFSLRNLEKSRGRNLAFLKFEEQLWNTLVFVASPLANLDQSHGIHPTEPCAQSFPQLLLLLNVPWLQCAPVTPSGMFHEWSLLFSWRHELIGQADWVSGQGHLAPTNHVWITSCWLNYVKDPMSVLMSDPCPLLLAPDREKMATAGPTIPWLAHKLTTTNRVSEENGRSMKPSRTSWHIDISQH